MVAGRTHHGVTQLVFHMLLQRLRFLFPPSVSLLTVPTHPYDIDDGKMEVYLAFMYRGTYVYQCTMISWLYPSAVVGIVLSDRKGYPVKQTSPKITSQRLLGARRRSTGPYIDPQE